MIVSKDSQGKRVVNLLGTSKQVKGFFSFGGLSAKSVNIASTFAKSKWEFKLEGVADINGKEVDYLIDVKDESNKVEYIATLDAGTSGISAQDVAGLSLIHN